MGDKKKENDSLIKSFFRFSIKYFFITVNFLIDILYKYDAFILDMLLKRNLWSNNLCLNRILAAILENVATKF